ERAYLTFRVPAGDRASVRITADVFQQQAPGSDQFYRGWVVRAKYAYLQYDFIKRPSWSALARGGLLHTVVIEHVEMFWPRWLSITPVERAGFFSSADGGVAGLLTLPNKLGEIYTTVTNGPGYTSRETDRFKDYSARVSVTPFSSSEGFIKTFTLTGWTYRGAVASRFVAGGTGQIGTIGSAIARNRSGFFLGVRDPRVTLGAEYATRTDGSESGDNTVLVPRAQTDSTGRLISGFAVVRPFQVLNEKSTIPLGLVGRWDRFTPNRDATPYSNVVIAGLIWDLNKRASLSFDYQEQTPHGGPVVAPAKTYFVHLVATY
ncbi:MAG: hypothetical protein M3365_11880, partial [Gemmatimonadota bacterium]|nr:hypothetical protein [Gemmatimonadota bacterium]